MFFQLKGTLFIILIIFLIFMASDCQSAARFGNQNTRIDPQYLPVYSAISIPQFIQLNLGYEDRRLISQWPLPEKKYCPTPWVKDNIKVEMIINNNQTYLLNQKINAQCSNYEAYASIYLEDKIFPLLNILLVNIDTLKLSLHGGKNNAYVRLSYKNQVFNSPQFDIIDQIRIFDHTRIPEWDPKLQDNLPKGIVQIQHILQLKSNFIPALIYQLYGRSDRLNFSYLDPIFQWMKQHGKSYSLAILKIALTQEKVSIPFQSIDVSGNNLNIIFTQAVSSSDLLKKGKAELKFSFYSAATQTYVDELIFNLDILEAKATILFQSLKSFNYLKTEEKRDSSLYPVTKNQEKKFKQRIYLTMSPDISLKKDTIGKATLLFNGDKTPYTLDGEIINDNTLAYKRENWDNLSSIPHYSDNQHMSYTLQFSIANKQYVSFPFSLRTESIASSLLQGKELKLNHINQVSALSFFDMTGGENIFSPTIKVGNKIDTTLFFDNQLAYGEYTLKMTFVNSFNQKKNLRQRIIYLSD